MTSPARKVDQASSAVWGSIVSRYSAPRTLRTRAAGAPFRVRAERDRVWITPSSSGIDRPLKQDEVASCWPHIAGGSPRSHWKHLTSNGSYLEAIYDDLADAPRVSGPLGPVAPVIDPSHSAQASSRREFDDSLLRLELESARDEIRRLRQGAHPTELAELRERLKAAEHEVRQRREAAPPSIPKPGPSLVAAQTQRDTALRDAEAAKATRDQLRKELAVLEHDLGLARDAATIATQQADRLAGELTAARASTPTVTEPSTLVAEISLGKLRAPTERQVGAAAARILAAVAGKLISDPNAAVAECRRLLERVFRQLWEAHTERPELSGRVGDLLFDLRGSAVMPDTDWHLAKNVWGRASAIVHDGEGTAPDALWIWLSTYQLAELSATLPDPAPRGRGSERRGLDGDAATGRIPGGPRGYRPDTQPGRH